MNAEAPEDWRMRHIRQREQRDRIWLQRIAQEAAYESGFAQGHKLSLAQLVQKLQRKLNLPVSPEAELLTLETAELDRIGDEMLGRLRPIPS